MDFGALTGCEHGNCVAEQRAERNLAIPQRLAASALSALTHPREPLDLFLESEYEQESCFRLVLNWIYLFVGKG